MSDRPPPPRRLRGIAARVVPVARERIQGRFGPLALLLALAVGVVVPPDLLPLSVAPAESPAVEDYRRQLAQLPPDPIVVVGFDPDLATYGEIRSGVRAALDDLLAGGAALGFVSFTPEGRALAAAEMARLGRAGFRARLLDLGFVAGAEAGAVQSVRQVVPPGLEGPVAEILRSRGGGLGAFDAGLVVGGMDISPRVWVEQVLPRVEELPLVAIAPTMLWPELAPYRTTGQLDALVGTVRDAAALVGAARPTADAPVSSALAILIGALVAVAVLVRTSLGGLGRPRRSAPDDETAE